MLLQISVRVSRFSGSLRRKRRLEVIEGFYMQSYSRVLSVPNRRPTQTFMTVASVVRTQPCRTFRQRYYLYMVVDSFRHPFRLATSARLWSLELHQFATRIIGRTSLHRSVASRGSLINPRAGRSVSMLDDVL